MVPSEFSVHGEVLRVYPFKSKEKEVKGHAAAPLYPEALRDSHKMLL